MNSDQMTPTNKNEIRAARLEQIIEINGHSVCIINVGISLVAEVSRDAITELNLAPGREIWCMFKSLSMDMIKI